MPINPLYREAVHLMLSYYALIHKSYMAKVMITWQNLASLTKAILKYEK